MVEDITGQITGCHRRLNQADALLIGKKHPTKSAVVHRPYGAYFIRLCYRPSGASLQLSLTEIGQLSA